MSEERKTMSKDPLRIGVVFPGGGGEPDYYGDEEEWTITSIGSSG